MSEQPAVTTSREPVPVSTVKGDRVCTGCGYNLTGQTIVREPHYDLFIVRCPECGAVTSVLEYPALGRWGQRWATIVATLWFIFLIGLLVSSSLALFGLSVAAGEIGTDAFAELFERKRGAASATFGMWWATVDPDTIVAEAGGWWAVFDPRTFAIWIPVTLVGFMLGWFWSVALLPVRARWLPLVAVVLVLVASLWLTTSIIDWRNDTLRSSWQAARMLYAPPIALTTIAYALLPLVAGLFAGRLLTRGLVRVLLPKPLVRGMGFLWPGGRAPT